MPPARRPIASIFCASRSSSSRRLAALYQCCKLAVISLKAVAMTVASPLPRTGTRRVQSPAAISPAADAMSFERTADAPREEQATRESGGEDPDAGGEQLQPQLTEIAPGRRPILQQHEAALAVRVASWRQRKRPGDVLAVAETLHAGGTAGCERRAIRDHGGQHRPLIAGETARHEAIADDEVDFAAVDLRDLSRHRIVERVADDQRPERLIGEPRRLGDDEEEPIADHRDVTAGWPVMDAAIIRLMAAGGSTPGDHPELPVHAPSRPGHDAEGRLELLAVFVNHHLHGGAVADQPRIGHVGAERRQRGHERGLRRGELRRDRPAAGRRRRERRRARSRRVRAIRR